MPSKSKIVCSSDNRVIITPTDSTRRSLRSRKLLKEKTRKRKHPSAVGVGDAYCFTAIERTSKLIVAWHLGKRESHDAHVFADKLAAATTGRFQVSTDGFKPYRTAIPASMPSVDFAQIVKIYATKEDNREAKYSPGEVIGTEKTTCCGIPNEARICTSHVERSNLTWRMQNRRMTRLTNGFSKKWANHGAALALHFAYYNFCRVHSSLKTTPAVAAGLEERPWTIRELIERSTQS